jgi:hypothetical protein
MEHRICTAIVVAGIALVSATSRAAPPVTAFTDQGQVTISGQPLNQAADFRFRLYDVPTGGTPLAPQVDQDAVAVANGVVTLAVDFGAGGFEGNSARWLELDLRSPPGSGNFTTLVPRQPLTPTPFALSTRGIEVDADGNVTIGDATLSVSGSSAGCGFDFPWPSDAICGTSTNGAGSAGKGVSGTSGGTGNGAAGVFGQSTGFSGTTYGGYFESFSPAGTGVLGSNTAFTGNTYGGFFISASTNGYGVYGANSGSLGVGVYGYSPLSTGTIGVSDGSGGIGVYGGATSPTGTTYAVYGSAVSTNGWAGYFIGGQGVYVSGSVIASCGTLTCSDARFKTHVESLGGALDLVEQLRPVRFDWNRDEFPDRHFAETPQIGLIAQELCDAAPEFVHEAADGYLAVDYARLTPVLVGAVQEQQATITNQRNQITDLTARLERLEAMTLTSFASARVSGQVD